VFKKDLRITVTITIIIIGKQKKHYPPLLAKILNKFQYTLYKKARPIPHLASCPPPKGKPLPSPSVHQGTSMGGRRRNSLAPIERPAMSTHKAIVPTRGTSVTPPPKWGRQV